MDIITDLDGTLADLTHRRHFVISKPKNWPAFQALAHKDPLIEPVAIIIRSLATLAHRIIVCSGRGEQERQTTEAWLAKHQITHNKLYMRKEGDYRSDDIVKEELLDRVIDDGFKPQFVFDDRSRVVSMWRRRGLVCAQVAEGDF